MIYVFPVTIPANTPATAPVKSLGQMSAGKISRVMVQFPSGVVGLAHLSINYGLHQLFPTNADADFSSSAETIAWDEDIDLDTPPYQIEMYGYNTDDTYNHTITVRVVMEAAAERAGLLAEIKSLFGG